jgi:hypothetical protein
MEDAYGELIYDDDVAITNAFGVEVDDLMEKLGGAEVAVECAHCEGITFTRQTQASNGDLLLLVRVLEFARRLHEGVIKEQAILEARALNKKQLGELLDAYLEHEPEPTPDSPETDEGKGDAGTD